jgi:hypothetical protein
MDDVFDLEALKTPGWADVPAEKVISPRHPRRVAAQFTRLLLAHVGAVARCRTGRAAALYLLVLRQSQLEKFRAERCGKTPAGGVRVSVPDLESAGLHEERVMRRATKELIELGLVRRILRPGHASLLEFVPLINVPVQVSTEDPDE